MEVSQVYISSADHTSKSRLPFWAAHLTSPWIIPWFLKPECVVMVMIFCPQTCSSPASELSGCHPLLSSWWAGKRGVLLDTICLAHSLLVALELIHLGLSLVPQPHPCYQRLPTAALASLPISHFTHPTDIQWVPTIPDTLLGKWDTAVKVTSIPVLRSIPASEGTAEIQ